MKIECKLVSFKGSKQHKNDFEFELDHNTAIGRTENADLSIIVIGGNPLTVDIPFDELKKYKKSIKHGERD